MLYIEYYQLSAPPCRKNQYDNVEEYYVVVRETGQRELEESHEETKKSTEKLEADYIAHHVHPNTLERIDHSSTHVSLCEFGIHIILPHRPDPKGR